ncbi:sarcolemmal membrane-associated protein-like isoform X2 [Halichondria panicea]|uniref:sarcolemmal membrane-associated protein-like isoform X2 n=1 Tax=Halichondria panicea TaxID=6063 RepID=UPI00312B4F35
MAMAEAVDVPKIVVVPHERSILFNKRECAMSEPQKVGRSVDKKRILQNNLIFDCRVLSRNHALIWFENGKFFIKDTKSSNGTFVNETRLSPSGEESAPRELRSKDIVQFGVNVNVDKKAHGCIIARVQLFINDVELPGVEPPVQQVLQIMQNALARELELETKLVSMQTAIEGSRQLANESMIAIVNEDELLSRLEMLENQLQVYAKNSPEDELKKQLAQAYEERHQSDLTSKNSVRNILHEKLEYVSKVNQLQRDYDKAEQECQKYKTLYDNSKQEHTQDVAKLSEQLKQAELEKKTLQDELNEKKEALAADLDHLKGDVKYKEEQLLKTKQRLEETEEELVNLKITMETDKQRQTGVPTSQSVDNGAEQIFVAQGATPLVQVSSGDLTDRQGNAPLPHPAFTRRGTLLASENQIEDKQREWEVRVQDLEEELGESEKTVRNLQTQLAGYVKNEAALKQLTIEELGRRMASNAITKSKIDLLQLSLEAAEEKVQHLQDQLTSEASLRSALQDKQAELDDRQRYLEAKEREINSVTAEVERARRDRTEISSSSSDESALRGEMDKFKGKYVKQLSETVRVKAENTNLIKEMEELRRTMDEQEKQQLETAGPREKRVKLLTIIALVSIGVALASWLT